MKQDGGEFGCRDGISTPLLWLVEFLLTIEKRFRKEAIAELGRQLNIAALSQGGAEIKI
jgi:hypothetical protein